jgi:hypothetical protein
MSWLRARRSPSGSPAPTHAGDAQRRDSAEYRQAHSEARQLIAAYLRDVSVTRSASELAAPSLMPSARIELARRSAA